MKLNEQGLSDRQAWLRAGYALPEFDREEMIRKTVENPRWVHFGAGNIFRAFPANAVQKLLNQGLLDTGLTVAEGFDYEIIEKINRPCQNYSILVTLKADGTADKTVVGSIAESRVLDSAREDEFSRLREIFGKDSLQMVTFTITEKGYSLITGKGEIAPTVQSDFEKGPEKPQSYMGKVASLLYARYLSGQKPLAMVSMDNCSHNGEKLYAAIDRFAQEWTARALAEPAFLEYVENPKKVSFPWTMIDKITPRPDSSVEQMLEKDGAEDMKPIFTSKNTYCAPYVNSEECEYLVIEDRFPNGRPELEKAGFLFADRETVEKTEKMKVCTCLNPLHTALAVFGCLLSYDLISREMQDPVLKKLVEEIGYTEGLPVVVNPGILNPEEFLRTVVNVRIPNPFMPDTPQRIASDTSQKLSVRFGETIKAYEASADRKVSDLKFIPLVFAGWLRYLMAVDDSGKAFELSPDPLLDTVCPYVSGFRLGEQAEVKPAVLPLLKNARIFGVDLEEAGMADLVCTYFAQMLEGPGAVRKVLEEATGVHA